MRIKYANNFVQKLGMGDPSTCVYRLIYNVKDKNDTQIAQGRQLFGPFFYTWSFSNNTAFPIAKNKNK